MTDAQLITDIKQIYDIVSNTQRMNVFSIDTLKSESFQPMREVIRLRTIYITEQDIRKSVSDRKIPPQAIFLKDDRLMRQQQGRETQLNLRQYNVIYLQSFQQFKNVAERVNRKNAEIEAIVKQNTSGIFSSLLKNNVEKQKSQRIVKESSQIKKELNEKVEVFLVPWNDHSIHFRICCIHDDRKKIQRHFWIYVNKENDALMARDRIIYIYMRAKNNNLMTRIKRTFDQKAKKRLVQAMLTELRINESKIPNEQHIDHPVVPPEPELPKINIPFERFDRYQQHSMQSFLTNWKNRAISDMSRSRKRLFFQINSIKLDKTLTPQYVDLMVDNSPKLRFRYVGSDKNHLIFAPPLKQVHMFEYEEFYHKNLRFVVVASKNRQESLYQTALTFQKIDRHVLGFSYELGLTPQDTRAMPRNYQGTYPFLICLEAVVRNIGFRMSNVVNYRKTRLIEQMGRIPNSYSGHLQFPYSPNTFKLVQGIVSKNQYPLTKQAFERTYLDLANFIQKEQNDSRNFCLYVSAYKQNIQSGEECYRPIHRLAMYQKKLDVIELKRIYENEYMFRLNQQKAYVSNVNLSNYKDDFERFDSNTKNDLDMLMRRFLLIIEVNNQKDQSVFLRPNAPLNNRKGEQFLQSQLAPLKYLSPMLAIGDRLIAVAKLSDRYSIQSSMMLRQQEGANQILWMLFGLVKRLYPYSLTENLKLELYHIRCLAQKHLPQFNRTLNRKGIGLENLASKYLLSLFTELPTELTYRIWDLLINLQDPFKGRIIVTFTLLLYLQATDLLPIFPINQFIVSVRSNLANIKLETGYVFHFCKTMATYAMPRTERQQKLKQLAQEKYLKRFILSKNSSSLPTETETNIPDVNGMQANQIKLLSLKQLRYPLPEPGYAGTPITEIKLLIHNLYILENVNVIKYRHSLVVSFGEFSKEFILGAKSIFTNWYITIPYSRKLIPQIEFRIVCNEQLGQRIRERHQKLKAILIGKLNLQHFHKDKAYKVNIHLKTLSAEVQQIHHSLAIIERQPFKNKGQSTLSATLCLKSAKSREKMQLREMDQYLLLCERLLDYDWNPQSNSGLKSTQKYASKIERMKRPLDEFGKQQYTHLRVAGVDFSQDDWIMNSKVAIEQLRAIFYGVFYEKEEQDTRLQFSIIYQLFTQKQNYQQFDFGLMLLGLIAMSDLSRQKKLTLLFCLCVHYQNCESKMMTTQTLNSISRQIHAEHGFLNACPLLEETTGRILEGWYYASGNKVGERRRDITQIVQDWAYICKIRYNYSGIVMGSNQDLGVLRSLLTTATLRQIMGDRACRFQVVYTYNKDKYLWSMSVSTSDFKVERRGVKFLNSYPKECQIDYLDSTAEILLNCQSMIPLQDHRNRSYEEFSQCVKEDYVLNYLIMQSTLRDPEIHLKKTELMVAKGIESSFIPKSIKNPYADYAIYRHENCVQQWRSCRVVKQDEGDPDCVVQFRDKPGEFYSVSKFELMNMAENLEWADRTEYESNA